MVLLKKLATLACISFFICSFFSCGLQQDLLFENRQVIKDTIDSIRQNYTIQADDLLQIRNLQNPKYIVDVAAANQLSATTTPLEELNYLVEADGTVNLPIIGRIAVADLTRVEAAQKIEARYSKELKAPIIELKVINRKVTVLGEVTKQGNYPLLKDQTTLIETLGNAGGLTENANPATLKIIRAKGGQQQVISVDLSDLKSIGDNKMILQNNDIIYVAQNKRSKQTKRVSNLYTILQPVVLILNTALIIYTLSK